MGDMGIDLAALGQELANFYNELGVFGPLVIVALIGAIIGAIKGGAKAFLIGLAILLVLSAIGYVLPA